MAWNNGLVRTSEYWSKYVPSARRVRGTGPRTPFPFDRERNGGIEETLRRAKALARKR